MEENHPAAVPDPLASPTAATAATAGSLDHALLESLFYNELMAGGDEATSLLPGGAASLFSDRMAADPQVVVEQDLLSDFGVQPVVAAAPPLDPQQLSNQQRSSNRGIRHSVVSKSDSDDSNKHHQKMVDQFATLAERLGVPLTPQVLEKLVPKSGGASAPAVGNNVGSKDQIQAAAAESIATVANNKRSAATNDSKPAYSKRRKKPRLHDCELRLSQLQAEHDLLTRHLENITNQNDRLNAERERAEQTMRDMMEANAPDEELEPVLQNFTEMYSDYGKKRQEELNFHLEQLQRYEPYFVCAGSRRPTLVLFSR